MEIKELQAYSDNVDSSSSSASIHLDDASIYSQVLGKTIGFPFDRMVILHVSLFNSFYSTQVLTCFRSAIYIYLFIHALFVFLFSFLLLIIEHVR